jgi:hypothetical protein
MNTAKELNEFSLAALVVTSAASVAPIVIENGVCNAEV